MARIEFEIGETSAPFWEAVERSELHVPWCLSCETAHFPPRPFCPNCWGDRIEWRRSSGDATLVSFTEVQANPPSAFRELVPFVMGIVRLDEGPQMLTHIVGDTETLECDDRVAVDWATILERKLPVFRPVNRP